MFNKVMRRRYRHNRITQKVKGSAIRPRVCVFKSNKYLYAQAIDDTKSHTVTSIKSPKNVALMANAGKTLSESLKKHNIKEIVFDRGGYKYHGRVAALAESMRKEGLKF